MFRHLAGYGLASGAGILAHQARALTPGGAVGATGVGGTVFTYAPPAGSAALAGFFVSSSWLTRLPGGTASRDVGGRTFAQVLANGGVAAAASVVYHHRPRLEALALIGGALAAATADTWATEIGTRLGGRARLITTLQPVSPGVDGAVSVAGTAASVAGACVLSGLYAASLRRPGRRGLAASCATAGVAGSLLDSLLGATLERRPDAGGLRFLGNDGVNTLNTVAGASVAALLCHASVHGSLKGCALTRHGPDGKPGARFGCLSSRRFL